MIEALIFIVSASLVTAIYLLISQKRSIPHLHLNLDKFPDIEHALSHVAGLTGGSIHEGVEATVYQDGELVEALIDAIDRAQHTVHFESFVWAKGELEERFTTALCNKAQEGLVVRVLVDALGAFRASGKQIGRLQDSGVEVARYHPINRFSLRRFNNRTHRKLMIIDGEAAFTFGHGVKDTWCGHGQDKDHWRDTGVRLRGSIVCSLQVIFAQDWIDSSPNPPVEDFCFLQTSGKAGPVTAHVVASSAQGGHSAVALLYMLAIACARKEIIIQNPYFAPDQRVVDLISRAVERGVDVHLMIPGVHTDSPFLRRAGQRLYKRLLKAGVRLYEFEPTLLHQKIVIIDNVWSHIGSTNFDARSLVLNAEIGVGLLDRAIASELREAFEKDLSRCRELRLADWQRRPWYQHLLDWCAYQLHGQI